MNERRGEQDRANDEQESLLSGDGPDVTPDVVEHGKNVPSPAGLSLRLGKPMGRTVHNHPPAGVTKSTPGEVLSLGRSASESNFDPVKNQLEPPRSTPGSLTSLLYAHRSSRPHSPPVRTLHRRKEETQTTFVPVRDANSSRSFPRWCSRH